MKYNVQNYVNFIHLFVLVQGQVNRNFQLVLNENVPVGQVEHGISTALPSGNKSILRMYRS